MGHYISNLRDIEFNLFEVLGRDQVLGHGPFADTDEEMARDILAQVDRLAREDLAESFEADDRNTTVYDPEARTVTVPEGMKKAYRTWMDSGFWGLGLPEDIGGQPAPASLVWAMSELVLGAHPGVYLYNMGPAFAAILHGIASEEQKKVARLMVEKEWNATMVLTDEDETDLGQADGDEPTEIGKSADAPSETELWETDDTVTPEAPARPRARREMTDDDETMLADPFADRAGAIAYRHPRTPPKPLPRAA